MFVFERAKLDIFYETTKLHTRFLVFRRSLLINNKVLFAAYSPYALNPPQFLDESLHVGGVAQTHCDVGLEETVARVDVDASS